MSRPKPTVLLQSNITKGVEQILAADAIYAVFYDGKAINLKTFNGYFPESAKYRKTSFSNSGHAFNLAERLNKKYQTELFSVVKLINGETIIESTGDES